MTSSSKILSINFFKTIILLLFIKPVPGATPPDLDPIRVVVELNINESKKVELSNGEIVELKLLGISTVQDSLNGAIRSSDIKVSVDGTEATIGSGNYNLPVTIGKVQIDCPVVKEYYKSTSRDAWELQKDARFRLWPKGSPYIAPGTFVYPVKQTWFVSMTQSGNEPTYVPRGESYEDKDIYYHSGLDIGGAEGMDEVVSATDGLVISANNELLEGYEDFNARTRGDVVYILDNRGWSIRYSHLDSIDPAIKPGSQVKMGQRIGFLGKQGKSGGWAHLHFSISTNETFSGEWGVEEAFPYAWDSYVHQYDPPLLAIARPHKVALTGQEFTLDGRKSRGIDSDIVSYEWIFSDGRPAEGPVQNRIYAKPGEYSEILKVTDSEGNTDYDFTVVQVYDREHPERSIPTMQASFHPTQGIKPGDTVTFLVRTYNTDTGRETWDFGDGTPKVSSESPIVTDENRITGEYAKVKHSFEKAGRYVVKVQRADEYGNIAVNHLEVVVNE